MSSGWSVVESTFRLEHALAYEGLFTLGSGRLHMRGSLEEHLSGAPQNDSYWRSPTNVTSETFRPLPVRWGTFIPGVYGTHPILNAQIVNLPWLLELAPRVDGERLDFSTCRVERAERTLHLDTASLSRAVTWNARSGATVEVTFERFISAAAPALCVQRMTVRSDRAVRLEIEAGIDADVRTNGFDHFRAVSLEPLGAAEIQCAVQTDHHEWVDAGCALRGPTDAMRVERESARRARVVLDVELAPGAPLTVEKHSAMLPRGDAGAGEPRRVLERCAGAGYDALFAAHAEVWRQRWALCDVEIDGDAGSQLAARVSLFHLLRAHPRDGGRTAIDAKGYAGEAYWGRFFWDTEMYLVPFFAATDPPRARELADFRVNTLDGAIANARRYGYPGARYAWESDADGRECCPNWQYADHEVHVTADVVYGLASVAAALGGSDYLRGPAARVIVETARFWTARVDRRPGSPAYHLLGVMGPDEYTPISDNNAYTNHIVAFALRLAAEHGASAGASEEERRTFRDIADSLPIPRAAGGGLILQCEGFDLLAEPRFEELWLDRTRTFAAQVSQERLYRCKAIKQADVLMMMMLFPQDFSDEEVRTAWAYYLPYTTHDSSLSAGAHARVALRLGLESEAWEFWKKMTRIDLDVRGRGAAQGIHIANCGAIWQVAVQGFGGFPSTQAAGPLHLTPHLPAAWARLAYHVVWNGSPLRIEITAGRATVENRGDSPVRVRCFGGEATAAPGGKAELKRRG